MYRIFLILLFILFALGAAACTGGPLPRELTATAVAQITPEPDGTPVRLTAPTPTPDSEGGAAAASSEDATPNPTIVVWIDETSEAHQTALEAMAAEFTAQAGVQVELVTVAPRLLPDLVQTAVLSGTLPDLILHPMEYTVGWTEQGILDPEAAGIAVEGLGAGTFAPAALEAVTTDGQPAAVPSDGWLELLIYRQDWFEERQLPPPTTFQTIISATAAIYDVENGRSGLVVPTESSLVTTQQVFEYLARANGCDLIDDSGEVQLLHPACLDALDYYRELINNYSPSDVQTDVSALNAYLAGRTGLIVVPSSVLPQLAGLDPTFPLRCPECDAADFLVENSGIVTAITGRSDFAQTVRFAELSYLGITTAAQRQEALAFVNYWFNDGYMRWLSVNPERKVPLRGGTARAPQTFLEQWGTLPLAGDGPSLSELYGADVAERLGEGVWSAERWAFDVGQGALMTAIYEDLTLSIVLQELLSGYFTSSYAIIEAQRRVVDLIPGYAFETEIDVTPTDTP